jgi:hypothetical protein
MKKPRARDEFIYCLLSDHYKPEIPRHRPFHWDEILDGDLPDKMSAAELSEMRYEMFAYLAVLTTNPYKDGTGGTEREIQRCADRLKAIASRVQFVDDPALSVIPV